MICRVWFRGCWWWLMILTLQSSFPTTLWWNLLRISLPSFFCLRKLSLSLFSNGYGVYSFFLTVAPNLIIWSRVSKFVGLLTHKCKETKMPSNGPGLAQKWPSTQLVPPGILFWLIRPFRNHLWTLNYLLSLLKYVSHLTFNFVYARHSVEITQVRPNKSLGRTYQHSIFTIHI